MMVSVSRPRTFCLAVLAKRESPPQIPVVVVRLENEIQAVVRSQIADRVVF